MAAGRGCSRAKAFIVRAISGRTRRFDRQSLRMPNLPQERKLATTCCVNFGRIFFVWLLWALLVSGRTLWRDTRNFWLKNFVVTILLGFSTLFCLATAYGRVCLGLAAAQGSRYMTYLIVAFFAVVENSPKIKNKSSQTLSLGLLFVILLLSAGRINTADRLAMTELGQRREKWKACYLARESVRECDALMAFQVYT